MKRRVLTLNFFCHSCKAIFVLLFAGLALNGYSQVATYYTFSQSNGAYTPITGGNVLITATDHTTSGTTSLDGGFYAATIPFNFNYNGVNYTSCNVHVNGYVTFGSTPPTATGTTPISTTTAYDGAIAIMARDLWGVFGSVGTRTSGSPTITGVTDFTGCAVGKPIRGTGVATGATITAFNVGAQTITMSANATSTSTATYIGWPNGEIRAEAIGIAPNRTFVIQFSGMSDFSTTAPTGNSMDFQVLLAEGGGLVSNQTISLVYGPSTNLSTTSKTQQVGLRGLTVSDFNNRTATTMWSATTAGATNTATVTRSNTIFPASGLTFTWTPPPGCSGTPTAGTASAAFTNLCTGSATTLNLTGYTSGTTGITFQWQQSATTGGPYVNVTGGTGATTPSYSTPSLNQNTYYVCQVTCTNSGQSVLSNEVAITTSSPSITGTTPGGRCGPGILTLQATGSSGSTIKWYTTSSGGLSVATGNSYSPNISSTTTYYAAAEVAGTVPSVATVGAGSTTSSTYSNPFYSLWSNLHNQHLVLASELLAAGLNAGPITALGINITSAGTLPMLDFSMKMANTNATNLSAYVAPTFTNVYATTSLMPTVGINTITFTTPFIWDGVSNVVIEICHGNSSSTATMDRTASMDATSYVSTIHTHRTSSTGGSVQCTDITTNVTTYSLRPQFFFTYTPSCASSRTAVIGTINTAPTISATTTNPLICSGGSTTLNVTSSNAGYTYTWTPGNITGNSINVNPSANTSYTVSAIDNSGGSFNGCTETGSVNVAVQPASVTVAASPQAICASSGSSVLSLAPSSGYGAGSIQWQDSPNGTVYNNIAGATNSSYATPVISSTTYYKALINDGLGNICHQPSLSVVVGVPVITGTVPATRCGVGQVNLQATGSSGSTIKWYANATGGPSIATGSTYSPTINSTTTFYVAAETGSGLSTNATVGAGATTSATYSNPFYSLWSNSHNQHLILASELYAAGMSPGEITAAGINITAAGTLPMIDFSVKVGQTTATNLSSYVSTAFSTVFTAASVMPVTGVNTITFTTPFVWDGVSNVVIEICHGNPSSTATMSRTASMDNTSFISTIHTHRTSSTGGSTQCTDNTTNVTTYSVRPQFFLTYIPSCSSSRTAVTATLNAAPAITTASTFPAVCPGGSTDLSVTSSNDPNYTYSWTSSPAGFTASGAGPHTVSPSVTTKYYVQATDNSGNGNNGCAAYDSITITTGAALVSGTVSSDVSQLCNSGSANLTVTGASGGAIQWQKSTVSATGPWTNVGNGNATYASGNLTQTTYFQVTVSCQTNSVTSNVQTVAVNNPQLSSANGDTRCGPGTVNLTASTNTGVVSWYANATGGAPLATGNTYAPAITGTTTYYAAAEIIGSPASSTIGTGSTTSATYSNPFYSLWSNLHNQHLILASELNAAGVSAGSITSLGINITAAGTLPMIDFSVKLGNTTATDVSSYVTTSFTTVYTNASLMPVTGVNTITFTTPFFWDGVSNVVIEICHGNPSSTATMSRTAAMDATSFISTIHTHKTSSTGGSIQCTDNTTNVTTYSVRPQFYLTFIPTCSSARTAVIASMTTPPAISVTPNTTICSNTSATLSVSSSNDPNYTYTWMPGNLTGSSVTVNPSSNTTYTISAIDNSTGPNAGCINSGSVTVNVNPAPTAPVLTPANALLCEDDTVKLKVQHVANLYNFGTQQNQNAASTTSTGFPAPYTVYYGGQRMQFLILASELQAQGYTTGSKFNSLNFPVVSKGSNWGSTLTSCNNFQVSIGMTTLSTISAFQSGLTQVVAPANFTPVGGYSNAHVFNSPFVWDGTSNIIIETTFSNNITGGTNDLVTQYNTNTSYQSCIVYRADGVTAAAAASATSINFSYNARPDFRLYGSTGDPAAWSPVTDLFEDEDLLIPYTGGLADSVYSHPSTSRTYTATTTLGSCTASSQAIVTVDVIPQVNITAAGPTSYCPGSTVTLNASTDPTYTSYAWAPNGPSGAGATSFTVGGATNTTTVYTVTATGAGGCTSHQTIPVTVFDTISPSITVIGSTNLCSGQTTADLQGDIFGATGPAQNYAWSTSETSQLITVFTGGTYSLVTTDVHGCETYNEQVITESAAPIAPIISPSGVINICSSDGGATYSSITLTCTNYSSDLLWSTSETTTSIVVDYPDNFNVTYTDPSGCFSVSNQVTTNAYLASDAATSVSSDASFNAICLGNTVTLSVNGGFLGDGADWHWYEGSCGGTARGIGSSVTLTPTTAGTHTYFVRAEGVCNTTACVSISILVSTAPPQYGASITTSPVAGCNGTTAVMSGPTVNNASYYNWSCSQGGVLFNGVAGPVQTATPSVNVTFVSPPPAGASGYSICVFAGNACGQSLTFCRFIRARVSQPSTITGSIIACSNQNLTYSVGAVAGADTYTWTITGNAGINGGGATVTTASPSITVNYHAGWTTGTLSVYASLNCGFNSAARTLAISSTPAVPGIMSGPGYVCAGSSASFSVPAVNGAASYNWTTSVPGAVITPNSNSASILFPATIPAGSTVCVSAVSSCGNASAQRCKSIANGIPSVPGNISGPVSGQCGQSGVSYSITPVSQATSYLWTATNGATVSGPNNLSAVSINFPSTFTTCTLSVVAINSCGTSSARTIVVSGVPAQPGVISGNQSVCNGSVEPYSTTGSTGATGYNWTVPAGATILNTPPYTSSILVMWGPTGGNVSVSATNDCGSSSLRTLAVAVTCRQSQVIEAIQSSATIYPNPTGGITTLKFDSKINSQYSLRVVDLTGRVVLTESIQAVEGSNLHEIDLSSVSKGLYMVRLESDETGVELLRVTVE